MSDITKQKSDENSVLKVLGLHQQL